MSRTARLWLFLTAAAGMAILLLWGLRGTAPFGVYRGPYGDLLNAVVVPERHVTDMATAINFDYRGMDTLGEEFILFAAVAGGTVLLRRMGREDDSQNAENENAEDGRTQEQQRPDQPESNERVGSGQPHVRQAAPGTPGKEGREADESEAVQWLGSMLSGLAVLYGIYIVLHAHQTPGGGFQGGAILGTACLVVYLTTEYRTFREVAPKGMLEVAEAAGAGGYALIGLATLAAGGKFLQNMLPLGKTGSLLSGGTIPLINLAVGLEVAAGFVLIFTEFLKEAEQEEAKEE